MIIWIEHGRLPADETNSCRFGRWLGPGATGDHPYELPTLVTVRTPAEVQGTPEAFLVPPGLSLHEPLLATTAATGRKTLVFVNGLGEQGLALLRGALSPGLLTLAFDSTDATEPALFEQLAWLARQPEGFAVVASEAGHLAAAAMAGAEAVLTGSAESLDLGALRRIAAARRDGATRPTGPEEADRLSGQELCLTVTRPLKAGDRIAVEDLSVMVTEYRGLAPTMRGAVVGRVLRYPVAPGEAVHFGHLR